MKNAFTLAKVLQTSKAKFAKCFYTIIFKFRTVKAFTLPKVSAFTLAEVLITLSIIGVVAILTISPLITSYKEKTAVVKFKKFYVEMNDALRLAEMKEGEIQYWGWTGTNSLQGSTNVVNILSKYLNVAKVCPGSSDCKNTHASRSAILLSNGILLNFNVNSSRCQWNYPDGITADVCGTVVAGVNRNLSGTFWITKQGIVPWGRKGSTGYTFEKFCTKEYAWQGCTAWILEKGNMDYLKRTVSWDE